jgi:hypothetical protein
MSRTVQPEQIIAADHSALPKMGPPLACCCPLGGVAPRGRSAGP